MGALADPSSTVSIALTGLLTISVAIFGMKLLGGHVGDGRDAMADFLKLAIVLLLATSWPAWRVIGHDVVLNAPAEIAHTISGAPDSPLRSDNLGQRLQSADDGLVAITSVGSGRLPGADLREEFRGVALADEAGFAWGRVIFLLGVIGPYAIVRLGAGILLCLAPLMAASLLFDSSRSLFHGWIRGLVFAMLGSLVVTLVHEISLAVLEPWIANVIASRNSGAFTPSAPTELAVMSLVFAVTAIGTLVLMARITFMPYFSARPIRPENARLGASTEAGRSHSEIGDAAGPSRSRADVIADSVAATVRRENMAVTQGHGVNPVLLTSTGSTDRLGPEIHEGDILGSKYRRDYRRSTTSIRRDHKL